MPGVDRLMRFRPLLISHAGEPDFELFQYAAAIGSNFGLTQALVAVAAGGPKGPGVLVTLARRAFPDPERVAFRLLFDPDPATLFQAAEEERAELIVAPASPDRWAGSAEQLVFESPHPVWIAPQRYRTRLLRALVRVDLTMAGASLLDAAASACRMLGMQELVICHLFSQRTLDQDNASIERERHERILALYELLERLDLGGVQCIPVVEETLHPVTAALRLVREHAPDVMFDSFSWPGIRTGWSRREAGEFVRNTAVALINIPAGGERPSGWRILKSRLFMEREPVFR